MSRIAAVVRHDVILCSSGRLAESLRLVSDWMQTPNLPGKGQGVIEVGLSPFWADRQALALVSNDDAGVASSLLNTGQQVGGSIGLAILGTVAWSAVASNLHAANLGAHATKAAQLAASNHALAHGFGQGYLVSAGIALLGLIVSVIFIRVKPSDLQGIDPMAAPAG